METSDFGNLLQNKLNDVVNRIQNPEETDEEKLLFKIHNTDELLIALNNLSENVQPGISTDDILILKQLITVFDDLRKELILVQRRKSSSYIQNFSAVASNGRPRLNFNKDVLEELRGFGFTRYKISKMLNVSRWTVAKRVEEFDLNAGAHISDISDEEVDSIVKEYINRHGETIGQRFISGHFKAKGINIQRRRVRESINRVDPTNAYLCWGATVFLHTKIEHIMYHDQIHYGTLMAIIHLYFGNLWYMVVLMVNLRRLCFFIAIQITLLKQFEQFFWILL